jgi:hypothetical protein
MISNTVNQPISQNIPMALAIPYVNEEEAYSLLTNEFERFSQLLDKLSAEDWEKPTACTAWISVGLLVSLLSKPLSTMAASPHW